MTLKNRLVGLCLIYAPNVSTNQCVLWDWLTSSSSNDIWIVGGDFNMVEWCNAREGGFGYDVHYYKALKGGLVQVQGFSPNL
jgi:hypothetical protein